MTDRFVVGIAYPSKGVVVLPTATLITEEDGGYVGKNVENAAIPIPESLTGCPDDALVFLTPSGLLAWECDGKLVTRFDHVNDGQVRT
jgi:hypothetical protein